MTLPGTNTVMMLLGQLMDLNKLVQEGKLGEAARLLDDCVITLAAARLESGEPKKNVLGRVDPTGEVVDVCRLMSNKPSTVVTPYGTIFGCYAENMRVDMGGRWGSMPYMENGTVARMLKMSLDIIGAKLAADPARLKDVANV